MKSLSILLLVCTYSLLIPSESATLEDKARLNMFDKKMQELNLKSIHFENPSKIVEVGTVINKYKHQSPQDIYALMMKKLDETADTMANGSPSEQQKLRNAAIDVPLPNARQIQSALAQG